MPKKMGRPKIDNPKSTQVSVRMDADTLKKLDVCTEKLNETRVEVIRRGIEKVFSEIKK